MGRPIALAGSGIALASVGALLLVSFAPESPQAATTDNAGTTIICGRVLSKPWSKTVESWDAGGSDYFVMAMDPAHAQAHPEYGANIILRTPESGKVTKHEFAQWDTRHTCVRGALVHATTYVPQFDWEQYPIGAGGQPLPRGSGILVAKIGRLADVSKP